MNKNSTSIIIRNMDIAFIKKCIIERKVRWTYHINMRLEERFIDRENILNSIDNFEIIEDYPEDKYLPSCLVYSESKGKKFHMVIALDYDDGSIVTVTAYRPSEEKWNNDLKTRRKP